MSQSLKSHYFSLAGLSFGVIVLIGCTVGPNYKRPTVAVPVTYREAPDSSASPASQSEQVKTAPAAASLGDEKWWEVFQDKELQALIRTALKNNYDLRIAATRVLEARAQLGMTRADQYPSLSAGGNITSQQNPKLGPIPSYELTQGALVASAAWNVDFWGRYRRATEAARATLLANEWAQKEVMATLVANLASSYFVLRQLDLQWEISKRTLSSREDSLQLTQTLEQHGINSLLDVRQSEQLVYTAATELPDLERQIALTYQQTIQGAFRDVSNALIAYRKDREFTTQQQHLVESAQDAARLSQARFKAGTTDYLEVLTNETNAFSAELGLAQAQGNELVALVQLYEALGGGWQ